MIKRRSYLRRAAKPPKTEKIPKRSWVTRRNKKRSAAEKREKFEREYGPPGFLDWIHAQPSVASGKGPCVAAHLGTGGVGRKGDWDTCIPLLDYEHRHELHQRGPKWFEAKYGISLTDALARTRAGWLSSREGEAA